jgi:hypothetical protein
MANRVVKFYFDVQNFPKGRARKNYVQAKRRETSVNFVNKAFLSLHPSGFWPNHDSFFIFTKKYLLNLGLDNA